MRLLGLRVGQRAQSHSWSNARALLDQDNTCGLESPAHDSDAGPLSGGLLILKVPDGDRIDPCRTGQVVLAPLQESSSGTALRRVMRRRCELLTEIVIVCRKA